MTSKKKRPDPGAGETSPEHQPLPAWSCDEAWSVDASPAIVLTRQQRERQAFHIITEAAVSQAELPAICQKILTDLLSVLDFDFATLRLYDPKTRLLNLTAIAGQRAQAMMDKFPVQSIDDPHYVGAFVARERKPVFAPEVDRHTIAETHAMRVREIGLKGIIACAR
jgi:GAF domain-containing protein